MSDFNPYQPTSDVTSDPFAFQGGGAPLATRGERFAGAFIDGIIQMIIIVPLAVGMGFIVGTQMGDNFAAQAVAQVGGALIGVLGFLAVNGYLLASQGRTVGKLVMKTRIVDRNTNQILPFWPLIGKRYSWLWAAGLVPVVGNFLPLVDALMIFRESLACLHDDIANTKVIKE